MIEPNTTQTASGSQDNPALELLSAIDKLNHIKANRAGEAFAAGKAPRASYQFKVVRIGEAEPGGKLDSPELARNYWRDVIEKLPWFDPNKEHLAVLLLNTRYNITGYNLVSIGSINESIAHPREVFRAAIVAGSYALILMHNHPSGDPCPSNADHQLTRRLSDGAELLQIKLLDHVIIGKPRDGHSDYFSFKEAGVL